MIPEKEGCPLVSFPAHESVKIIKAQTRGPQVKWTSRAILGGWRIVVLSKPGSGIPVALQDISDRCVIDSYDRIVTRIAGRYLTHHTCTYRVMIAARN